MEKITVRPAEAAQMLGIGVSSFWLKAKSDPAFPEIIKLSPRTSVVRLEDLRAYIDTKSLNRASS